MARPAKFGEPASETIRVRVTRQQRREIEDAARENDTDIASLIRDAINTYVADYCDAVPFRGPESESSS